MPQTPSDRLNADAGQTPPTAQPLAGGRQLDRQLDAIFRPTTVEDLARKGGQLKAVKERDLRELIRQSLLQLLQGGTGLAADQQERILDQVQADLKRAVGARAAEEAERQSLQAGLAALEYEHAERAAELGSLRAQLADARQEVADLRTEAELRDVQAADARAATASHQRALPADGGESWAEVIDEAFFAGRHRRDAGDGRSAIGEPVADALQNHIAACDALLTDYAADPPGGDPAGDIIARLRELLARRTMDQNWIAELQKRQVVLMTERDEARTALEAELARVVEAEERLHDIERTLQESAGSTAGQISAVRFSAPEAALEAELNELRELVSEGQARLDEAISARTRAERELAGSASGKAIAERRLLDAEAQLAAAREQLAELESQHTDQRRTTDLARLASVEAEALRAEVDGLKRLLHDREQVLAGERERHRADNAQRLDAIRRVEQALMGLRDQLAECERALAERDAELGELRARLADGAPADPELRAAERTAELTALEAEAAAAKRSSTVALAARDAAQRESRLAAAEVAALRAHQADAVRLMQERDLLRDTLAAIEAQVAAVRRPAPPAGGA